MATGSCLFSCQASLSIASPGFSFPDSLRFQPLQNQVPEYPRHRSVLFLGERFDLFFEICLHSHAQDGLFLLLHEVDNVNFGA